MVSGWLWGRYNFKVNLSLIEHKQAKSPQVILPGICHVPDWYGRGSTFVYSLESDEWVEIISALNCDGT